jgi:hypothetical protein
MVFVMVFSMAYLSSMANFVGLLLQTDPATDGMTTHDVRYSLILKVTTFMVVKIMVMTHDRTRTVDRLLGFLHTTAE